MKRLTLLLALLPALAFAEEEPRTLLGSGAAAYQKQDYGTAITNFARAAAAAIPEKLDPAVARFNEGNALLRAGRASEAGIAYEQALRTTDLGLQGKAYYNRGNALMADAEAKRAAGQFDGALKGIDEALAMYERSMLLNPRDRDPKQNHELAMLRREQVQEQKKQQEQQQDQNQNQQDKQQQQDKDQQKQDNQDPSKQDQNQQKNDQGQQNQQKDQQKQDAGQDQQKQDPQEADQQQDQPGQEGEPHKADKLTPEEAALLLDAMKQDEQAQRREIGALLMRNKAGREQKVDKDW